MPVMTAGSGIIITEFAPPAVMAALEHWGPVHYDDRLAADRPALLAAVQDARAIIVRNKTRVDCELLETAGPHLRVVGRLGAGLDNIDLGACRSRGTTVVSSPWGNAQSVAEHTLAAALALAKGLQRPDAAVRKGQWDRGGSRLELAGRTWGILGFGHVGRLLAPALGGLGVRCITHHPRKPAGHPDLSVSGVRWVDEAALFAEAEILSIHLPLRRETRRFVDAGRLSQLPAGALLINTSRGEVLDEQALLQALRAGSLGGAALDVREREPPTQPDPLAALPNVLLTPHIAGLTEQAQDRVARQVAEDVARVLGGERPWFPAG